MEDGAVVEGGGGRREERGAEKMKRLGGVVGFEWIFLAVYVVSRCTVVYLRTLIGEFNDLVHQMLLIKPEPGVYVTSSTSVPRTDRGNGCEPAANKRTVALVMIAFKPLNGSQPGTIIPPSLRNRLDKCFLESRSREYEMGITWRPQGS